MCSSFLYFRLSKKTNQKHSCMQSCFEKNVTNKSFETICHILSVRAPQFKKLSFLVLLFCLRSSGHKNVLNGHVVCHNLCHKVLTTQKAREGSGPKNAVNSTHPQLSIYDARRPYLQYLKLDQPFWIKSNDVENNCTLPFLPYLKVT